MKRNSPVMLSHFGLHISHEYITSCLGRIEAVYSARIGASKPLKNGVIYHERGRAGRQPILPFELQSFKDGPSATRWRFDGDRLILIAADTEACALSLNLAGFRQEDKEFRHLQSSKAPLIVLEKGEQNTPVHFGLHCFDFPSLLEEIGETSENETLTEARGIFLKQIKNSHRSSPAAKVRSKGCVMLTPVESGYSIEVSWGGTKVPSHNLSFHP